MTDIAACYCSSDITHRNIYKRTEYIQHGIVYCYHNCNNFDELYDSSSCKKDHLVRNIGYYCTNALDFIFVTVYGLMIIIVILFLRKDCYIIEAGEYEWYDVIFVVH